MPACQPKIESLGENFTPFGGMIKVEVKVKN